MEVTGEASQPIIYMPQYQVSFTTSPGNGGSITPTGNNIWTNAGLITITATAKPGYVFSQWSTNTQSITINSLVSATTTASIKGPGTITANFVAIPPTTYTVTFQSDLPAGTQWSVTLNRVKGSSTTNTITFNVAAGTYSWSVSTPISGGSGIQYRAPISSGKITVISDVNRQIQYQTQYYLTMQVQPARAGSISPRSGWYLAGTTIQISATASKGYVFTSWTGTGMGSYTGTLQTSSMAINGPITETALFTSTKTEIPLILGTMILFSAYYLGVQVSKYFKGNQFAFLLLKGGLCKKWLKRVALRSFSKVLERSRG
jgi:hypothetical protein